MSDIVVKTNCIPVQDYTWTYKVRFGDSKIRSRLRYKDDYQQWQTRVPLEGSAHPDIPGLALIEIDAEKEEGDLISVVLDYESADWNASYPGRATSEKSQERFSSRVTLNDEPLFTFPEFDLLSEEAQTALVAYANSQRTQDDYNEALSLLTSTEEVAFLTALRKGQEAWRAPGVIWVRKRIVKSLSEIPFEKVGKIDVPPKDPNGFPATEGDYNWMYLPPDFEQSADGKTYELTEYWEKSYKGGWVEFFYAPDAL